MARYHNGVRELDFDRERLPPQKIDIDLPPSCVRDGSYRWQDDPRRYEPQKEKRKRR